MKNLRTHLTPVKVAKYDGGAARWQGLEHGKEALREGHTLEFMEDGKGVNW